MFNDSKDRLFAKMQRNPENGGSVLYHATTEELQIAIKRNSRSQSPAASSAQTSRSNSQPRPEATENTALVPKK